MPILSRLRRRLVGSTLAEAASAATNTRDKNLERLRALECENAELRKSHDRLKDEHRYVRQKRNELEAAQSIWTAERVQWEQKRSKWSGERSDLTAQLQNGQRNVPQVQNELDAAQSTGTAERGHWEDNGTKGSDQRRELIQQLLAYMDSQAGAESGNQRTPAAIESALTSETVAARKSLARLLGQYGFHLWWPRDLWNTPEERKFLSAADRVRQGDRTLLGYDRLYVLWQAVRNVGRIGSHHAAEVGTYRGGSAAFLASAFETLRQTRVPIHVIDTFRGHLAEDIDDDEAQRAGEFSDNSYDDVLEYLAQYPEVRLTKGSFSQVAPSIEPATYILVHIDTDLYRPTVDTLAYYSSRLAPSGIIVVDDFTAPKCAGVTRAVREFLASHEEFSSWSLMTEQAVLVRRG